MNNHLTTKATNPAHSFMILHLPPNVLTKKSFSFFKRKRDHRDLIEAVKKAFEEQFPLLKKEDHRLFNTLDAAQNQLSNHLNEKFEQHAARGLTFVKASNTVIVEFAQPVFKMDQHSFAAVIKLYDGFKEIAFTHLQNYFSTDEKSHKK